MMITWLPRMPERTGNRPVQIISGNRNIEAQTEVCASTFLYVTRSPFALFSSSSSNFEFIRLFRLRFYSTNIYMILTFISLCVKV